MQKRPQLNLDEIYNDVRPSSSSESHGPSGVTRTQFLKGYGHDESSNGGSHSSLIRQNMRSRLKCFCHHVRWICRNIVNLEAIESRKDIVTFKVKYVQHLKQYATSLLNSVDKLSFDTVIVPQKSNMPDMLKLLHALESVVAREYVAPILSVNYLKHIQGMGASLMRPHWALDHGSVDDEKLKTQELSQHMIPIYFNLMTLLHLLDMDLHNSLFFQCTNLLQKWHMVASGRSYGTDEKTASFYDQHVPFLTDAASLFELIHEMIHESSSSLTIPSSVATLWVQEIRLALDLFELYK